MLFSIVGASPAWGDDPVTVSKTAFDATSGSLNGDNKTSYAAYRGGGTSEPAVYSKAIRLYQNSGGSTGGYVVIGVAEGYLITSATIRSTSATTTGYKLTDTDPGNTTPVKNTFAISNHSLSANTDYTVDNISTRYITFACFGTTSSTRLNLSKISITYQAAGGGSSAVATTTTIDATGITNTDVYTSTTAGTLTASVTETESGDAVDGATVTWSGDNDDVATINASTGVVTLVAAGTVTFTASYAGVTNEYQASSDTYELTVTSSEPYVQPTEIEITPNYTFWGKSGQFSGNDFSSLSGSKDNVSLSWSKGGGSTYANTTAMRFYKDNDLTFTAPTGYEIVEIAITGSLYGDEEFSPGSFANSKWTGSASEVTMSRPSNGSSYATISKFTITLAEQKASPSLSVSTAELSLGYNETKSFTISKTGDGELTVVSNDTDVATVAADGETPGQYNVTYVGDGSTTISVTSSETSTYASDTKTVTITAADARAAAGISFASASQIAVIAEGTSFTQALTNTNSVSPITWTSSDETVATVASDGTVTLKKAGTVSITASFAGNATYKPANVSYTLTITNKKVATLVFDADAIEKNSTDASFTNAIATDPDPIDVVYSSSNTDVATVNASTGEVTIVGGGTTTITATIDDDAYEATEFTYTLTVNKVAAPISFSSASATTALDETESFVTPTLSNPQSLTIAYSSSNTDVATVDAGTGAITFNAVGSTTITATSTATAKYNSGEVSYTLTVAKAAENLPFSATFASSLGDFTVTEDATLGELWAINSSSAKASAYKNNKQNAGESWLISPYINITNAYATLSFDHADQYFNSESEMEAEATLWIREKGGDWEQLTIANYPSYTGTTKSGFQSTSNSLSSYSGKKVQIGFKYLGNDTKAGSWFVKNFRVADDREEAPISFATATVYKMLKDKDTYEGQELTNTESLTVNYSSSDTDVATVNASTGVVTIKAVGETDITATYTETASYKANTATYKLVVTSKAAPAIEYADDAVSKKITLGTYTHTLTNPNDLTVAYSSSDETVATVNASTGEVTMLKVGETTITATFTEDETYDGGTASYTLTVIKDDPVLSFTKSSVNVGLVEGTYTQAVTATPADLPVTYSSSDETVATVNPSTGEATLLKNGSTTITASFAGNDSYNSTNTTYTLNVVIDYAELPFSFNNGYSKISTTTGLTQSGINSSDYSTTNTKLKFDGTGDYLVLKIAEVPGTLSFDIKGNSFSGGTFKVQTSADGESYTDLKVYSTISDGSEKLNLAGNVRYIKWIYTSKSSGNVGLGNISLTKTNTITLTEACTDGTKYYSTYSLGKAFVVPEGLTVSTIGIDDGKLVVTNYETGNVVKANTGVMVSSTTAGAKTVMVSAETGTEPDGNLLKPSGDAGISAANMAEDNTTFYRLTMHKGTQIGFWWGAAEGAAFALAANKAYLAVPNAVSARVQSFWFTEETTGIKSIDNGQLTMDNEAVYDLQGRKVQNPKRGIYIINGKKVIVK